MKVLITKSNTKWGKKMAKIIPREVNAYYTKLFVEAITNEKVEEIKYA